jgi:predicted DNA-binding protein YlxM (UPF0122 family)
MRNIENIPEREYDKDEAKHPTASQLLLRLAIDNTLTYKQKRVWNYYNYDRMSLTDIGLKMNVSKQAIDQQIKVIENRLKTFCDEHKKVHKILTRETYGK